MTNLDVMKQKIQQMDVDEAAEWFSENCDCPDYEYCGCFINENECIMCWKRWFEKESRDD